ncbi:hypothetical protein CLU97_3623 [Chryseobacterium sp. 7]|uniref:hypothetical protein n=1 Tax=Chryseobacterium sp. 7 TaxID=2035214 RepID=UPI000F1B1F21|nr:hypothetical protein [Chryseobacterium sp. 7]RLJ34130.1 hypothetical protein CLU97_3623 [Chryseobacterium sp. 7]
MDRNYFLSYSHKITLILLLAAVGKLNAKFISVTMTKPELSYSADSNNHLQGCLAGVSIHLYSEKEYHNLAVVNETMADQNETHFFYCKSSRYNLNFFNNSNLQQFFQRDVKFIAVGNKWNYPSLNYKQNNFLAFEEGKKFYTNSIKLVDGFKFIIKIPDKLIHSLIS